MNKNTTTTQPAGATCPCRLRDSREFIVTWRTHEGLPELCPDRATVLCPLRRAPQILTAKEQVGEEL